MATGDEQQRRNARKRLLEAVANAGAEPWLITQGRLSPARPATPAKKLNYERPSPAKKRALEALVADGPITLWELAERLCCTRSNVTQLMNRLEAQRLVRRAPDPADRRSVRAEITEEGRAMLRRRRPEL